MNIYAGNLSLRMTGDELRKEFAAFGEVTSVVMMNDEYIGSGQHKRYGYVEMASKSEGLFAITNLNGKKLSGQVIDLIEALPLSDNTDKSSSEKKRVVRIYGKTRRRTLLNI